MINAQFIVNKNKNKNNKKLYKNSDTKENKYN